MINPNQLETIRSSVNPDIERHIDATIAAHHRRGGKWPLIIRSTRGGWTEDEIAATLTRYRGPWNVMRGSGDVICVIEPHVGGIMNHIDYDLARALREAEAAPGAGSAPEHSFPHRIVNLTPHEIVIPSTGWRLAPSGTIARASERHEPAPSIGGEPPSDLHPTGLPSIPTSYQTFGAPEGLPAPAPGTYLVVSMVTAMAAHAAGRATDDLLVPGAQIRDEAGRVTGCGSLVRWRPAA